MQRLNDVYAKYRIPLLGLAAVGVVTFAVTAIHSPQRAWGNLLLDNFYFVSIALYGVVFVALNYVLSAGWAVVFRRVPEAMTAYLPVGAALMLAVFLGRSVLYPWADAEAVAESPALQHKAGYFDAYFVLMRMAVAFGVWTLFSLLLRRYSLRQDADGDLIHTRRSKSSSAIFLLLCAVTFIFSSIDWIMSLEPEWYSTIFPVYCCAGLLLGGSAALGVLLVYMQRGNVIPGISNHHVYELARIICATSTLWAYIWFSQYMLIYYTNMPEEAVYFVRRLSGAWRPLFWLSLLLNWVIPLVILIPASTRRSPQWLLRACVIVLVGRWLDAYLLVMPALGRPVQFGPVEVLVFVGLLALFTLLFLRAFRSCEPVPKRDPYLVESVHLRA